LQTHELESSIFPKSEVLSVHLALLNYMRLHGVLYSSYGVIKFDILAYGLMILWRNSSSPDFKMSCVLFRVAIDCHSCLWYAISFL